ncbi:MAG: hypothetical protein K9G44_06950 [Melioribacteraceae bacterium]|nr:hypothetical protein [Melioribacteraceae bacterium]
MEPLVEMFWHRLERKISDINLKLNQDLYSKNKNDYILIAKKRISENTLIISFEEENTHRTVDIEIKIFN